MTGRELLDKLNYLGMERGSGIGAGRKLRV